MDLLHTVIAVPGAVRSSDKGTANGTECAVEYASDVEVLVNVDLTDIQLGMIDRETMLSISKIIW